VQDAASLLEWGTAFAVMRNRVEETGVIIEHGDQALATADRNQDIAPVPRHLGLRFQPIPNRRRGRAGPPVMITLISHSHRLFSSALIYNCDSFSKANGF
jgi:hypothetical protein